MSTRNEPFDRQIIETLRKQADAHVDDLYDPATVSFNWLWFSRMVATMEKGLPRNDQVS